MMVELLHWIAELNLQFYKTERQGDYIPSGPYHFYLKYSMERFTAEEIMKIYTNKMDDELADRWNWAVAQSRRD